MDYKAKHKHLKNLFVEKDNLLKKVEYRYANLNRSDSLSNLTKEKQLLLSLLEDSFYLKEETIDLLLKDFQETPIEFFLVFFNTEFDSVLEDESNLHDQEDFDKKVFNKNEQKTADVLKEICTETCTLLDLIPDQERNPNFYYGQE